MTDTIELQPSPLDSHRFGIIVERGRFDVGVRTDDVVAAVKRSSADLIILRLPAGQSDIATGLLAHGEAIFHADTLVYHGVTLPAPTARAAGNVRRALASDRDAIAAIAKRSFRNYKAHYAANPLLPQDAVLQGYVEWAQSRLDAEVPAQATWVVVDAGQVAGFATCDVSERQVEIVLNAVDPAFERRGHYGALLSHLMHYYSSTGLERLIISTQIWNYTVQRQWARAGLLLDAAYDTYHVERRLSARGEKGT